MKDGIAIFYVKDEVLYPIALTERENEMVQATVEAVLPKIRVVQDRPMGCATIIMNKQKEDKSC